MGKVSGQNLIIRFLHISLAIGGKCNKTTRTQEVQGMGTNPFRLFLVSLNSTNWYTSDSKWRITLGYLPSSVENLTIVNNSHRQLFITYIPLDLDVLVCVVITHLFEKQPMMNYKMMFGNIWIKSYHPLYLIWKCENKIDHQNSRSLNFSH
jgi:hypothetical protein